MGDYATWHEYHIVFTKQEFTNRMISKGSSSIRTKKVYCQNKKVGRPRKAPTNTSVKRQQKGIISIQDIPDVIGIELEINQDNEEKTEGQDNLLYANKQVYLQEDVYIHVSSVSNAGLGVYTSNTFHKGDIITKFECTEIDDCEVHKMKIEGNPKFKYILKMRGKFFLGLSTPEKGKGLGSFINTSKNAVGDNNRYNNCNYSFRGDDIYIVATERILAYHELFLPYGVGCKL